MKYYNTPYINIDVGRMRTILQDVYLYYRWKFAKYVEGTKIQHDAYIEDGIAKLSVTCKYDGELATFYMWKDGREDLCMTTGQKAFAILSRYYKVPRIKDEKQYGSALSIIWWNEKYNNTRQIAYSYDLNSAFTSAMCKPMPDTTVEPRTHDYVGEGEIGFVIDDVEDGVHRDNKNGVLRAVTQKDHLATYIFPLIESPFKKFAQVWYDKKRDAKNKYDKAKAKQVLNYSVGYLQLVNPFIRATILTYCNDLIYSLIDKNTLFCNTDNIVSLVRRPDIEKNLGIEMGQWKLEHDGEEFAYHDSSYQWNREIPKYRGIPKSWFTRWEEDKGRQFDLLLDALPPMANMFELDHNTLEIKEIKYGTKKKTRNKKLSN